MRLMVLYTFIIFGHFIMTFSGHYVGFNLGRSLSGGYMMRLAGMGIVDPVYTTISQRCFHNNNNNNNINNHGINDNNYMNNNNDNANNNGNAKKSNK